MFGHRSDLGAIYIDWRNFSNTFISSYVYKRGTLKIQVDLPKKSILAENTIENTKINVFEIQYHFCMGNNLGHAICSYISGIFK